MPRRTGSPVAETMTESVCASGAGQQMLSRSADGVIRPRRGGKFSSDSFRNVLPGYWPLASVFRTAARSSKSGTSITALFVSQVV